ncbi:MAG TPA: cytochrome c oxidase assembly factor Coa1 family protein [Polyangiaceae bacterium]|nr:cytochrome c oxidase assembly factor Coa1 family protein [Polyangiaceae bacterium]
MQYTERGDYSQYPSPRAQRRTARTKKGWFAALTASTGLLALLCGGLMVLLCAFVFVTIKSSDAYETGLRYFTSHPVVIANLGRPIHDGLIPTGSLKRSAVGGHADLSFSLSGPKGKGQAHMVAIRGATGWTLYHAEWTFKGVVTQLVTPYGAPINPYVEPEALPGSRPCSGPACGGATSY